jgi:spermidine/putrescine transport system ATP-binding protein
MNTSQQKNLLQLSNISKTYQGKQVLKQVNLTVQNGEFLTLLGPSGCGKTTLLRIVAGLEQEDHGQIILNQSTINHISAEKRQINTVFQSYALFPHMSVIDNVMFGLKMHRVPKQEAHQRAVEALEKVKLTSYLQHKPHQLSGGQQQRVAIARAVVNRPQILLLDEPLSALDYKLRQEMQMELKRLQRQLGITFLFVTHDQEEALSISDRIVVLKNGDIEQIGTPKEIYENPANMFVAKFIGQTNIFKAKVVSPHPHQPNVYHALIENQPFEIYTTEILQPNAWVNVLLRPEDIRIQEIQDQAISTLLTGRVIERTYKGMTLDSVIEMSYGDHILVSEFFNEDDPDTDHSLGQRVEVSWVPSWEVVLPHD